MVRGALAHGPVTRDLGDWLLLAGVNDLRAGDSLLFTDWRGDSAELLAGAGSEVARVL